MAEIAARHGKFAGTVVSIETQPGLIETGYRFIGGGADVVGLTERFKVIAEASGHVSSDSANSSFYKA